MKKISKKQSRKNIKKRRSKVAVRHAKAGTWEDQPRPMFGSGKVHFEVGANTEAMNFGGIAPVPWVALNLKESGLNWST